MERTKLVASEGKILTNGEIYGRIVYLGQDLCSLDFYEITEEEYELLMEQENQALDK